jgi:hypothetical protein
MIDMFEYTVILIVVGAAVWFTGRNLWREVRQGQCSHCYCKDKKGLRATLIQLGGEKRNDNNGSRSRAV